MKAHKFIKRNRTTAGRATGTLLCQLSLPGIDAETDWRRFKGNPERVVEKIRHFIERHLPKNSALLKDASFVIQAEVRASSGGLRRKRLAKWKFGDDLDLVFKTASQAWAMLESEEDYAAIEVEI
ncbi:MAG: hypothetical protein ABI791_14365 [Acidobacteriota bacterium]